MLTLAHASRNSQPPPQPSPEGEGVLEFRKLTHFTPAATRLAGLTGALLGWRPDAFWQSTPAELATIIEALTQRAPAAQLPSQASIQNLMEMYPDD